MRSMEKIKVATIVVTVLVGLFAIATVARAANERFKAILSSGVLRVGVQQALKPWSFRDTNGQLIGFEVDLANEVADTLGVKLELVPVESSNRMQFLQQGKVDLLIAAMGDIPERHKIVGMVEPHYFASGANILAKKGEVKSWSDLREKPVCGKQGVLYLKLLEQDTGAHVIAFTGNTEALEALRSGKCIAYLTDDTNVSFILSSGQWDGYEMPLQSKYVNYWSIGVPLEELDGTWGRFMSGMIYHWHATGKLVELEKKWGFLPMRWFSDMHKKLESDSSE